MDLYDVSRQRMVDDAEAGVDWKLRLGRLSARLSAAESTERREHIVSQMTDAFLPMLAWLAGKHACHAIGLTARDQFEVGAVVVPRACRNFDAGRNKAGQKGCLNFIAQTAEWEMLHEKARRFAAKQREAGSLDAIEAQERLLSLIDESAVVGQVPREDVMAAVVRAVDAMPPVDRWIARRRLFDEASWNEITERADVELGRHHERHHWASRWQLYIRPRLEAEMWRAGLDCEEDVSRDG